MNALASALAALITLSASAADAPKPKAARSRASGKVLKSQAKATLDGKPSKPKPDTDRPKTAEAVRGEVAGTDVFKGMLTVRAGRQSIRDFAVPDTAKIRREAEGKPGADIPLEAIEVGDAVEVYSADGKSADVIRVRAAR